MPWALLFVRSYRCVNCGRGTQAAITTHLRDALSAWCVGHRLCAEHIAQRVSAPNILTFLRCTANSRVCCAFGVQKWAPQHLFERNLPQYIKAASTHRQPNQARQRGQRLNDSCGQAHSRQQLRAEEPQQDHARGHPQETSDDAGPILDGVGYSADQGVEPRSRQHAEAEADLRRKGAARGARTHPRTPFVWAYLGLIKSLQ